jgi:hypothetical protein
VKEALHFNPTIPDLPLPRPLPSRSIAARPVASVGEYIVIRSREICDMASSYRTGKGDTLADHCDLLIGHLLKECSSMSETCDWHPTGPRRNTNDKGWAIGLAQWHLVWQYPDWLKQNGFAYRPGDYAYTARVREKFFADHPELKDWRGQVRKYLADIQAKIAGHAETRKAVLAAIDSWNADPGYVPAVRCLAGETMYRYRCKQPGIATAILSATL